MRRRLFLAPCVILLALIAIVGLLLRQKANDVAESADKAAAARESSSEPSSSVRAGAGPATGKSGGLQELDASWLAQEVETLNPGWKDLVPMSFLEDPANAFNWYLMAAVLMVPPESVKFMETYELITSQDLAWSDDPEKVPLVAALLSANSEALAALKKGIMEGEYYHSPPGVSLNDPLAHLKSFRYLARLMRAEALVLQSKGETRGALADALGTMKMAWDMSSSSNLPGALSATTVSFVAESSLQYLLCGVRDPAVCREAVESLEELRPAQPDYSRLVRRELDLLASEPELLRDSAEEGSYLDGLSSDELAEKVSKLRGLLEPLADTANLPYPEFAALTVPEVQGDPVLRKIADDFWLLHKRNVAEMRKVEARVVGCEIVAGLKLYHLETGGFPESLGELVPAYLRDLPVDPYSGEAFRYSRTDTGARIYSIGPDLKDDLGRDGLRTGSGTMDGDFAFEIR